MKVEKIEVGNLLTNCYILESKKQGIIIDPGAEARNIYPINQKVPGFRTKMKEFDNKIKKNPSFRAGINGVYERAKNLDIKYIFLTHGHFDHVLGVAQLKKFFPNTKLLLHEKDLDIYKNVANQLAYFFNQKEEIKLPHPDSLIKKENEINFGNHTIKILATPGHTTGSVTFLVQNIAFTGDLIFKDGSTGRTDMESGDENEIKESITKILKLPPSTIVYPGHGEKFKLSELKNLSL